MAMRVVEKEELDDFLTECKATENDLKDKDIRLEALYDRFEKNLVLLGATAVEDMLQ